MRPRGEVRVALLQAARELRAEVGHFTAYQVADRAQVAREVARLTVKDMAAAGELVRVGMAKAEHSSNWMRLYELNDVGEEPVLPWGGIEALAGVVGAWASGSQEGSGP